MCYEISVLQSSEEVFRVAISQSLMTDESKTGGNTSSGG